MYLKKGIKSHNIAVESEVLGEECSWILIQVHVVSRQKLLKKLRFLVLNCLDDKLPIISQVEDASGRPWIRQLLHRIVAQRQLKH